MRYPWPEGRRQLQRYLIARLEADRHYEAFDRANQDASHFEVVARAYVEHHGGPVSVHFNNDPYMYEARINELGTIVLEIVGRHEN